MATYFFNDITADQALAYTAAADQLIFTGAVTASQVSVIFVPFTATTPDFIVLQAPGRSVTFADPGGIRGDNDIVMPDS